MKTSIFSFWMAIVATFISSSVLAQTVNVSYLNPSIPAATYDYLRIGNSSSYFGGILMNGSHNAYGNGNDLSIFTYSNRDLTIRTGTGNFIVFPSSGGKMGVGNVTPSEKLDVTGNISASGNLIANGRTVFFGANQKLIGDNNSALYFNGGHSTITQLILRDKEGTKYGRLFGSGNGQYFGLLDGDSNWALLMSKDNYTSFRIDNSEKMRIKSNGHVGIGIANPSSRLQVLGGIRASTAANEYLEIAHGGSNAFLNNKGDGAIDLRHEGVTKFSVYDNGAARVYGLTGTGTRMVTTSANGTLGAAPLPTTVFTLNADSKPYNSNYDQFFIGTNNNKFTSIPVASRSKLYVKNDNDEMLAFERAGVNHIFEFRMGSDGHLVLGKRTSGSNGDREIVMRFDNDSGNNFDKKAEFESTKVYASEMEVNPAGKAPDYVFQKEYDLKPLAEVDAFVQANKHLPNFPKGEVYEDQFEIGTMSFKMIEKIEELTLYTIAQDKQLKEQATLIQTQSKQIEELINAVNKLSDQH